MIDNEFVKEAREANAKGLDAGYTVSELLKVIDQQQAEIERLKTAYETLKQEYYSMFSANRNLMAEVERLNKEVDRLSQCVMYHDGQIIDAIKEFAERLTDTICNKIEESSNNPGGDNYFITDVYEDIDNLVKELTKKNDKE